MVTTVGELNGLGRLLGRVIDEKLEEPEKKRLFERMRFTLGVHVTDMGQSASVTFAGGEATVARGRSGRPDLAGTGLITDPRSPWHGVTACTGRPARRT